MEKVSVETDLDDWEFLPDDFLDFNQHEQLRRTKHSKEKGLGSKGVIRPFPTSHLIDIASKENSGVTSPVPIELEKSVEKSEKLELEIGLNEVPFVDVSVISPVDKELNPDTVSRVFFKKMKENEFVDMKMDSPKSPTKGLTLLTDPGSETYNSEPVEYKTAEQVKDQESTEKNLILDSNIENKTNWEDSLNIMGWRVNGVGALCCVGVAAAATICIFIFGGRPGNKKHQNQKIQFQITSDGKKTKQVHQDHILSQVIAAARDLSARGLSASEAHVYFKSY